MKNSIILFVILFTTNLSAQNGTWVALPNAPVAGRHDDMQWLTSEFGYVANSSGQIWKTRDGGKTWEMVYQIGSYFRSLAFTDTLNGWAGTINSNSLLHHTADGGKTWSEVTNIPSPKPKRICGMSVVNDQVIYGSSAFDGPPVIIKTVDGGKNWSSIDMSPYAQTLIDIKFFSADTGIVTGGGLTGFFSYQNPTINSVVLYTTNGGLSWTPKYTGTAKGEWGWKIFFVNRKVGYISLEAFNDANVLKTTDGGLNWVRYHVDDNTDIEGIGFADELLGWTGGYGQTSLTTDGGQTWKTVNFSGGTENESLDRFKFFGDSIGYAAGKTIYKYTKSKSNSVSEHEKIKEKSLFLLNNYPNPFNPSTTITYYLPEIGKVKIRIFNSFGQEILDLFDGTQSSGNQKINWNGKDGNGKQVSSGVYYYRIDSGKFSESRVMTLIK